MEANKTDMSRKVKVFRSALNTILSETKEPIIRVYAKSALDETKDIPEGNAHCEKHNWYGLEHEICPMCSQSMSAEDKAKIFLKEVSSAYFEEGNNAILHPEDIIDWMTNFAQSEVSKALQEKEKEIKELREAIREFLNTDTSVHYETRVAILLQEAGIWVINGSYDFKVGNYIPINPNY